MQPLSRLVHHGSSRRRISIGRDCPFQAFRVLGLDFPADEARSVHGRCSSRCTVTADSGADDRPQRNATQHETQLASQRRLRPLHLTLAFATNSNQSNRRHCCALVQGSSFHRHPFLLVEIPHTDLIRPIPLTTTHHDDVLTLLQRGMHCIIASIGLRPLPYSGRDERGMNND